VGTISTSFIAFTGWKSEARQADRGVELGDFFGLSNEILVRIGPLRVP
jgi:hypothetical protein